MTALEEIKKALEGVTPGPWKWFGNANSNHVYLATTHSGRRYVMDFVRWGMKGAQPRFQPERGGMVDAKDLLQFEVGDQSIVGMDAARKDGSVYRYDVRGIDCPDARYIAAVNPAAISELLSTLESLQRENEELRAWQAGAISCREAEQARIDDYKRELEEALCAHDLATRKQTEAFCSVQSRAEAAEAEVKRLREALERFLPYHDVEYVPNTLFDIARQALASTGGEHHAE